MRNELEEKIMSLDKDLEIFEEKIELVIVGGAAFVLKGLIQRSTRDIDYLNKVNNKLADLLEGYNINNRVITFETTFGEWEDDIEELQTNAKNIKLKTISNERLLAARMFSRKRFDDLTESFKNLNASINQTKFENILLELIEYNNPIFIGEFRDNKYLIDELYKTRGWNETENTKRIRES